MPYRSKHVCKLFDISAETVRTWAEEFSEYLSVTANPGKGKHRLFSDEDMTVLALVAESKDRGITFAEIHANLKSGQRGHAPDIPADEIQKILSSDSESRLELQVEQLQTALVQAETVLKKAERELEKLREVEDENIRLKTQLEEQKKVETKLELQIDEYRKKVEDLSREIGREYLRGYIEGKEGKNPYSD